MKTLTNLHPLKFILPVKKRVFYGTFLSRSVVAISLGLYAVCIGVCVIKIEQLIIGAVYGSLAIISMFVGILVLRIRLNSTRHLELEKMWQNKRRHDITDTMKTVKKQITISLIRE